MRKLLAGAAIGGAVTALAAAVARRRLGRLRVRRGAAALGLAARGGARYAASAPRLFASAGETRQQLRNDLALQTAEDVAATLGAMKGVLMKIGQMASYVDDGLAPSVRRTLRRLQDSVPPMSPELAAGVVEEELGLPPERAFASWDAEPIAAASIGQVHRAITHDGRAVAVKVQYPGIAETIAADLGNVALLRRMLKITAPAQDVDALLAELRDRVIEELDYRREADNQRLVAAYYDGHPTIGIPAVVGELSTRRVITSELSGGARFAELAGWPQEERDLAAETIYRFVFRSLYEVHAFNGDPHPGNYLFHGGGRVTFLDFGLVKHFTPDELRPLMMMARNLCVQQDPEAFRRSLEDAGFLPPGRAAEHRDDRRAPGGVLRDHPQAGTILTVIGAGVAAEQFGYGFGFTALLLYMIYLARGRTRHGALRHLHRVHGFGSDASRPVERLAAGALRLPPLFYLGDSGDDSQFHRGGAPPAGCGIWKENHQLTNLQLVCNLLFRQHDDSLCQ